MISQNVITNVLYLTVSLAYINLIVGYIQNKYFIKGNLTTTCGHILSVSLAEKAETCSMRCLSETLCKGFLFSQRAGSADSCKLLTTEKATILNQNVFGNNYTPYSIVRNPSDICGNLAINVSTPTDWQAGCPRLYFPLDNAAEGTAVGPDASVIDFITGKIDNSFYFPNPEGNKKAYFNLGHYPNTSYCFPEPEKCPEGVTYAFWLNILGSNGHHQGFITTALKYGPGFIASWLDGNILKLSFAVLRDSDTLREIVSLSADDFIELYGFGTWVCH